eukprot:jgi/Bigna1/134559/aug1.25_g9267
MNTSIEGGKANEAQIASNDSTLALASETLLLEPSHTIPTEGHSQKIGSNTSASSLADFEDKEHHRYHQEEPGKQQTTFNTSPSTMRASQISTSHGHSLDQDNDVCNAGQGTTNTKQNWVRQGVRNAHPGRNTSHIPRFDCIGEGRVGLKEIEGGKNEESKEDENEAPSPDMEEKQQQQCVDILEGSTGEGKAAIIAQGDRQEHKKDRERILFAVEKEQIEHNRAEERRAKKVSGEQILGDGHDMKVDQAKNTEQKIDNQFDGAHKSKAMTPSMEHVSRVDDTKGLRGEVATSVNDISRSQEKEQHCAAVLIEKSGKCLDLPRNVAENVVLTVSNQNSVAQGDDSASSSAMLQNNCEEVEDDTEGEENEDNYDENDNKLYCFCRGPYMKKYAMVQCGKCNEWYHTECVGLEEDSLDTEWKDKEWFCQQCLGKKFPELKPGSRFYHFKIDADRRTRNMSIALKREIRQELRKKKMRALGMEVLSSDSEEDSSDSDPDFELDSINPGNMRGGKGDHMMMMMMSKGGNSSKSNRSSSSVQPLSNRHDMMNARRKGRKMRKEKKQHTKGTSSKKVESRRKRQRYRCTKAERIETGRRKITKTFTDVLGNKTLGIALESDLFLHFGGFNEKYQERYRILIANIRHNGKLLAKILRKEIPTKQLMEMDVAQLAPEEINQQREELRKAAWKDKVIAEEDRMDHKFTFFKRYNHGVSSLKNKPSIDDILESVGKIDDGDDDIQPGGADGDTSSHMGNNGNRRRHLCPNCGEEDLTQRARFCSSCGTKLHTAATPSPSRTTIAGNIVKSEAQLIESGHHQIGGGGGGGGGGEGGGTGKLTTANEDDDITGNNDDDGENRTDKNNNTNVKEEGDKRGGVEKKIAQRPLIIKPFEEEEEEEEEEGEDYNASSWEMGDKDKDDEAEEDKEYDPFADDIEDVEGGGGGGEPSERRKEEGREGGGPTLSSSRKRGREEKGKKRKYRQMERISSPASSSKKKSKKRKSSSHSQREKAPLKSGVNIMVWEGTIGRESGKAATFRMTQTNGDPFGTLPFADNIEHSGWMDLRKALVWLWKVQRSVHKQLSGIIVQPQTKFDIEAARKFRDFYNKKDKATILDYDKSHGISLLLMPNHNKKLMREKRLFTHIFPGAEVRNPVLLGVAIIDKRRWSPQLLSSISSPITATPTPTATKPTSATTSTSAIAVSEGLVYSKGVGGVVVVKREDEEEKEKVEAGNYDNTGGVTVKKEKNKEESVGNLVTIKREEGMSPRRFHHHHDHHPFSATVSTVLQKRETMPPPPHSLSISSAPTTSNIKKKKRRPPPPPPRPRAVSDDPSAGVSVLEKYRGAVGVGGGRRAASTATAALENLGRNEKWK